MYDGRRLSEINGVDWAEVKRIALFRASRPIFSTNRFSIKSQQLNVICLAFMPP
jgi:hypothetical protein